MWFRRAIPILTALFALAIACSDQPVAPDSPFESSYDDAEAQGLVIGVNSKSTLTWRCFTSVAVTGKSWQYEYRLIPLSFPDSAVSGRVAQFRFRDVDENDNIVRLANCLIPLSDTAIRLTAAKFGAGLPNGDVVARLLGSTRQLSGGSGMTILGELPCGNTALDPCILDPIYPCDINNPNDPECQIPDPGDGGGDIGDDPPWLPPCGDNGCGDGGGGGGNDPGDPGGGDDPCINCFVCGDERDTIIQEYAMFNVGLTPACGDFASYGGSAHFSWSELNGYFQNGNPHYPWGMVRPALTQGLEATRALYNRGGILVTSGYRCPHGNSQLVGASPTSYHMHGRAADMYSADHGGVNWTQNEFNRLYNAALSTGPVEIYDWHKYADRYLHVAW